MRSLLRSGCLRLLAALLVFTGVPHGAAVAAPASTLEAVNYLGMLEAQGNLITALKKLGIASPETAYPLGAIVTDGGYATAVATTFQGQPLIMSYQGVLSGTAGQNLELTFQGMGVMNGHQFRSSGVQTFTWDPGQQDYVTMVHTEQGFFGDSSWRLAGTAAMTGGEMTAAGFVGTDAGITNALRRGEAAFATANIAFAVNQDALAIPLRPPFPPYPFPFPPRPRPPFPPYEPPDDIFCNPTCSKAPPEILIAGSYVDGVFQGTVTPVPEPATWAMLLSGIALIASGLRRNAVPRRDDVTRPRFSVDDRPLTFPA